MSEATSTRANGGSIRLPTALFVGILGIVAGGGGSAAFHRIEADRTTTDLTKVEERLREVEVSIGKSAEWRRSVDEKLAAIANDVREIRRLLPTDKDKQ